MNYKKAINTIKNRRKNDLLAAESLLVDALRQYPHLREIEKELWSLKNSDSEEGERMKLLEKQRADFLTKIGLTQERLNPPPHCLNCQDTGLNHGKICGCVINTIGGSFETGVCGDKTFDDCDFSVFDERDLLAAKKAYDTMQAFCSKFPHTNILNILFYGAAGTGKTFLASCVADNLIKKGFGVLFVSAFDFVNRMLMYHVAPAAEKLEHMLPLLDCDLLVIDDLGTESVLKNVTVEYFYNVLNERIIRKKHTLITTNRDDVSISARYGERVASRLFDRRNSIGFALSGTDLRKKH